MTFHKRTKSNVVFICQPTTFSLSDVDDLVPILNRITEGHEKVIRKAMDKQRYLMKTQAPQSTVTEQDNIVCTEMAAWGRKMAKLGAKVFAGGYLGFNSGFGWWSYHYPETSCEYYHNYDEEPSKEGVRRKMEVTKPENIHE